RDLPIDPSELVKLPGIGRYTAGAVACFAFEKPVPAVDTNVARVIRRVFYGDRPVAARRIWKKAAEVVPTTGKRAWTFNQAVMELGAVMCRSRKPKCEQCPVREDCRTGKT